MADHVTLPILEETGYAVLDDYDQAQDPAEWRELEFVPWRSSGVTRFAPLASYDGSLDCNGFWNHTPPRADKGGVWIPAQADRAPALVRRALEPGADVGRCRVIELQANDYADCIYNLHRDDNNRLNPPGEGWIVRGFFNLTDDPDSVLILREDRFDPHGEVRIPLRAGSRVIVDTQRCWHAVWHTGAAPRYSLITSWESGSALQDYIEREGGRSRVETAPLDAAIVAGAQDELHRRLEERRRAIEAMDRAIDAAPRPAR